MGSDTVLHSVPECFPNFVYICFFGVVHSVDGVFQWNHVLLLWWDSGILQGFFCCCWYLTGFRSSSANTMSCSETVGIIPTLRTLLWWEGPGHYSFWVALEQGCYYPRSLRISYAGLNMLYLIWGIYFSSPILESWSLPNYYCGIANCTSSWDWVFEHTHACLIWNMVSIVRTQIDSVVTNQFYPCPCQLTPGI